MGGSDQTRKHNNLGCGYDVALRASLRQYVLEAEFTTE